MLYNPLPAMLRLLISSLLLLILILHALSLLTVDIPLNFATRYQAPNLLYWFGTDNIGRDLWTRCFQGALTSLQIGSSAAFCSSLIALLAAGISRLHILLDQLIRLMVDTLLALPHLLLLILICFTVGGGKAGVILAVSVTHWPKLTLILRTEIQRIHTSDYMILSQRLGNSLWRRGWSHYLPALLPQWFVGMILMFPHAILHSASLSFLGFGLAPHEPSLGILLSDALRFLSSGSWWLVLFPGLVLLVLLLLLEQCAQAIQQLWLRDP